MPTQIGSKLGMLLTMGELDPNKGMEADIVRCVRSKSNELTLDVNWYAEGTMWDGSGLVTDDCVIFSTPDGRVLPILQAIRAGRRRS